jgi:hypothetical protein
MPINSEKQVQDKTAGSRKQKIRIIKNTPGWRVDIFHLTFTTPKKINCLIINMIKQEKIQKYAG